MNQAVVDKENSQKRMMLCNLQKITIKSYAIILSFELIYFIMTKKELFNEIEQLNVDKDTLLHIMFDWFEADELEAFMNHLKEELIS